MKLACGNCQKKSGLRENCIYHPASAFVPVTPQHGLSDVPALNNAPPAPEPTFGDENITYVHGQIPAVFATEVRAVIDARLGLPSSGRAHLIPCTDAPLFGSIQNLQSSVSANFNNSDNVLPPRKHADHLIGIYWQYIQPIEPFLDQERFVESYQALFAGTEISVDESIFIATLNVAFALSTQLQENLSSEQRGNASEAYFQRAWALLRPEAILWEPGSLELV